MRSRDAIMCVVYCAIHENHILGGKILNICVKNDLNER